jgi:hypothetical protein
MGYIQRVCYGRCGKVMFDTKGRAKVAASKFSKQFGNEMGVYHCIKCGGFHMFTKSKASGYGR